ncbi:hypothetical protein RG959_00810 [Domibacillus sp. 8LH]|uniref:hypothetical protein n=1 Tax=Domibacillus sp. 8LH TaxID=3073900 RepID=UPI003177AD46
MKKFQPSINIVYDIGRPELFDQFVPNMNQIDILTEILQGIIEQKQQAHLMIGPYGAGKSMVGALAASLVSARKNSKDVKNFLQNVKTVNPESFELIDAALVQKEVKWVPVAITGKYGDFDQILLDSIVNELRKQDIFVSLKGDSEQILKTVALWKREYPNTYKKLEDYARRIHTELPEMLSYIESGDEEHILEFKKMYPHLTSGAVFSSASTISFTEQMNHILEQLKGKKIGLFIVYDEFGRFLQTVHQSAIYQTMQSLQDLAEMSNRSSNLGLLFITHTGLRQYAASNNNLSRSELERVEKRFADHRLESDPSLFYRSAFKVLEATREGEGGSLFLLKDIDYLRNEIIKFNLFPDMKPSEIDGAILEGCQPIHPLTIRMLPVLSNILGQNDRTLYTFLAEAEQKSEVASWYYADRLFDYFYPDESTFYLIEDLKFYRLAMSYRLIEESKRIVKMITLMNIANRPFSITKPFLQFALGMSAEKVDYAINELTNARLIRFNRFADSYELYSGSIVEFEELYQEFSQSVILNDEKRIMAIDQLFLNKYYLPHAYNSKKSMTRFIEAKFSWHDQVSSIQSTGDGLIVYILYRNSEEYQDLIKLVKEDKKENILFCIPSLNVELLQEKIDQYLLLNMILSDREKLKEDENLKSEIEIRIENVKYDIEQILKPIQQFDPDTLRWIFQGEERMPFASKEELEAFLSDWMNQRFEHTLEVRNEGFNKRTITTMQKKAAISILSMLLKPDFNGEMNISGYGPDYLIYATLLKNQRYDINNLDELENPELKRMREDLIKHVQSHSRGRITDLYQILLDVPYGMREPLVPILTVALLKDMWDQMAFYANDFYVSEMNAELLYEILEQQVDFYEYEMYKLSESTTNALKIINDVFFDLQQAVQPVIIFGALTEWLRKLPRYTQITEDQSQDVLLFKAAIRHSETDPLEAAYRIEKLLVGKNAKAWLLQLKSELEQHLVQQRKNLENDVSNILGVISWSDWINENQRLIQQQPVLSNITKKIKNEEDWLSYLIEKTVGAHLKDWSDITYDSFLSSVKQLAASQEGSDVIKIMTNDQTVMKLQEVELSVKGKTVYSNVSRIVQAGGRTMSNEEVKYIMYKILTELDQ